MLSTLVDHSRNLALLCVANIEDTTTEKKSMPIHEAHYFLWWALEDHRFHVWTIQFFMCSWVFRPNLATLIGKLNRMIISSNHCILTRIWATMSSRFILPSLKMDWDYPRGPDLFQYKPKALKDYICEILDQREELGKINSSEWCKQCKC